ncbi:MAG: DUF1697 domain-containing protein [Bacteroidia bacterium]
MKYIAMLRGINVSGQKMIKMTDLKKLFEYLGFENVVTYIQSGNVVFDYKKISDDKLKSSIKKEIKNKYDFDVSVIIRTPTELKSLLEKNPFTEFPDAENKVYFIFLEKEAEKERIDKLLATDHEPEKFVISGKEIFFLCPNGYGKAKLNNNVFERKLKVVATTRNLKTVRELVRLGGE